MDTTNSNDPSADTITDKEQFKVAGAYSNLLRLSALFGLAPLHFKKCGNGYNVSYSIPMCIYSYFLMTALGLTSFFNVLVRAKFGNGYPVRISQVVEFINSSLIILTASTGVYEAPRRIKSMLKLAHRLESVDRDIGVQCSKENRVWLGIVFFFLFFLLMACTEIGFALVNNVDNEWYISVSYIVFFCNWFPIMMTEVQFAFMAMLVYTRFKAVNKVLRLTIEKTTVSHDSGNSHLEVPLADVINRLASIHDILCEMVHIVNSSYNIFLVFILLTIVLNLIVTPYFAFLFIVSYDAFEKRTLVVIVRLFIWVFMHLLRLFVVIEPSHYTIIEDHNTKALVCHMKTIHQQSDGTLTSRLQMFSHQLKMRTPCYTAKGFCILDRIFFVTVTGIATTYVFTLIQFQLDASQEISHIRNEQF